MKFTFLTLAALSAGVVSSSAFSLDFTGLELDGSVTLSGADGDQLIINVPGFGNVGFGVAEKDLSAVVDDNYGVPAIEFDETKTITINFFAATPVENVMVSFVGVPQGDEPTYVPIDNYGGTVSFDAGVSGGIQSVSFDAIDTKVPEPSTTLLGLIGAVALLRRRR
ncbi:PEP-CTERM sorting domain-containing protein [Roseibacillus persicicus]|uniref:Ice-binding protein C-terminal domain-containing protein n=1 Tax=Roseibacillus persicicus TaxID=454148 RepID=A0A918WH88_9BACT|nr:PEP-CTERM sorting domain-containing protein [Roseibacillus persicicus]MDQ8191254.1 PEP-CTERM sorting domain-containing protein [Roseibacillus persicicus]GHC46235.1 hypothetical protein GCM10007100_09750 [Roseibacillus persicicus]